MSTREALHQLVDALPDTALPAVARYLEAVCAGCPPDDPYDDVPLSPEEEAMLTASDEAIARGDVLTHEEVLAQLAARRELA